MPNLKFHEKYLLKAQKYSYNSIGKTFPNPSVGCVIVDYSKYKNGKIIAIGNTGINGRPHAEEIALKNIKKITKNTTMYLTLEPCYHQSVKLSCVNRIIKSGIKNIYIATKDPDKRTNNKSINKLKKNKIYVNLGLTKSLSLLYNRFFFINKKKNRSYVKYKLAISKDFKIAKSNYDSKWISNASSRKYGHILRYRSDAILTTYNTIKYDDPKLTIRTKNYFKYKNTIIILDRKLKINIDSNIIKSSKKRKIIIFTMSQNKEKIDILKKMNCEIYKFRNTGKFFDMNFILKKCYKLGICSILVEAGSKLFTYMYNKKLIDELHLFYSKKIIGKNGISMYESSKKLSFKKLDHLLIERKRFINDQYYHYNM
tara:strand:- start:1030 stop:2139 length:1110 start_codon:yes stop_codon:yes gene_type:complete